MQQAADQQQSTYIQNVIHSDAICKSLYTSHLHTTMHLKTKSNFSVQEVKHDTFVFTTLHSIIRWFLHAIARSAKCILAIVEASVHLSVHHTAVLCQNGAS